MSGAHILVVDDHGPLRQALEGLLRAEGYRVTVAADGLEGLGVLDRLVPDLIIADIMMPRMDGLAFLAAVRARADGPTIPFIFLTARADDTAVTGGAAGPAPATLRKPFAPDELLALVRARLAHGRWSDAPAAEEREGAQAGEGSRA